MDGSEDRQVGASGSIGAPRRELQIREESHRRPRPRRRALSASSQSSDATSSSWATSSSHRDESGPKPSRFGPRQNAHAADEDESERVCRICRCEAEPDQPLYHPCKCTGSIRFCHQDCLKEWLSHSRKGRCELCDYPFEFLKVYSDSMPSSLPLFLQVSFLAGKVFTWSLFGLRCIGVAVIWLAFVPWANINFFRSIFWIANALVWASGASSSTWSGMPVLEAFINSTLTANTASASIPAEPAPLHHSIAVANLTTPTTPPKQPALSPDAAMYNLTLFALSLLKPSRAVFFLVKLLRRPLVTIGATRTAWSSWIQEAHQWDWATPLEAVGHDIFKGQVLTCVLVITVIAAWFTREWVLMHLPAHVPDVDLRDQGEQEEPRRQPQQEEEQLQGQPHPEPHQEPEPQLNGRDAHLAAWAHTQALLDALEQQQTYNDASDSGAAVSDLHQPPQESDLEGVRLARLARFAGGNASVDGRNDDASSAISRTSPEGLHDSASGHAAPQRVTRSQSAAAAAAAAATLAQLDPGVGSSQSGEAGTSKSVDADVMRNGGPPFDALATSKSIDQEDAIGARDELRISSSSKGKERAFDTPPDDFNRQTGDTSKGLGHSEVSESLFPGADRTQQLQGSSASANHGDDDGDDDGWSDTSSADHSLPSWCSAAMTRLLEDDDAQGDEVDLATSDGQQGRDSDDALLREVTSAQLRAFMHVEAERHSSSSPNDPDSLNPIERLMYNNLRRALLRREKREPGYVKRRLQDSFRDLNMPLDGLRGPVAAEITDILNLLPARRDDDDWEDDEDDEDLDGAMARARLLRRRLNPRAPLPPMLPGERPDGALQAAPDEAEQEEEAAWEEVGGELEGLMEAIGFRGDPAQLLANVSIVIAMCSFFVIFVIGLPYFIARLLGLGTGLLDIFMAPVRLLRLVTDPIFDFAIEKTSGLLDTLWHSAHLRSATQSKAAGMARQSWERLSSIVANTNLATVSKAQATPQHVTASTTTSPFESAWHAFEQGTHEIPRAFLGFVVVPLEARLLRAETAGDRTVCCILGWLWISFALVAKTKIVNAIDSVRNPSGESTVNVGPLPEHGVDDQAQPGPHGARRPPTLVDQAIAEMLLVLKVLAFLAIEILVFPIGCGIIQDISTLPLFGASLSLRWSRLLDSPITFVFIRWASGTLWMFRFGLYVSHVRGILRPGVLSWIRDPEDPDFQPIKEILDRKASTQLRKIGSSAIMYGTLILAIFAVNSWALLAIDQTFSLGVLPLRLQSRGLDDGEATGLRIPVDLLVMLVGLSTMGDKVDPETIMADASCRWWRLCAYHLGLTQYLFEKPHATGSRAPIEGADPKQTFLARVPASDNSVMGSPLLIVLDDNGEPLSERGKEAKRLQEDKISQMKDPKAKYMMMRLPNNFGLRIKVLLLALWLFVSSAFVMLLLPVLIGRWSLGKKDQQPPHDAWALLRGLLLLSPLVSAVWWVGRRSTRVHCLLDSPALGGMGELLALRARKQRRRMRRGPPLQRGSSSSWLAAAVETNARSGVKRRRLSRKVLIKAAKRFGAAATLLLELGVVLPTLLGLTIDQLWIAPIRSGTLHEPPGSMTAAQLQSSLSYCWTLGLLLQQLMVLAAPHVGNVPMMGTGLQEVQRRGIHWSSIAPATLRLLVPVGSICAFFLALPHILFVAADSLGASRHADDCLTLWLCHSAARLAMAVCLVAAVLYSRLDTYQRELRDIVYLQASELKNYEEGEEQPKEQNESQQQEKLWMDLLGRGGQLEGDSEHGDERHAQQDLRGEVE